MIWRRFGAGSGCKAPASNSCSNESADWLRVSVVGLRAEEEVYALEEEGPEDDEPVAEPDKMAALRGWMPALDLPELSVSERIPRVARVDLRRRRRWGTQPCR